MALIDDFNAELQPIKNGTAMWSRGMGAKAICWFLYLILLELRKTK